MPSLSGFVRTGGWVGMASIPGGSDRIEMGGPVGMSDPIRGGIDGRGEFIGRSAVSTYRLGSGCIVDAVVTSRCLRRVGGDQGDSSICAAASFAGFIEVDLPCFGGLVMLLAHHQGGQQANSHHGDGQQHQQGSMRTQPANVHIVPSPRPNFQKSTRVHEQVHGGRNSDKAMAVQAVTSY